MAGDLVRPGKGRAHHGAGEHPVGSRRGRPRTRRLRRTSGDHPRGPPGEVSGRIDRAGADIGRGCPLGARHQRTEAHRSDGMLATTPFFTAGGMVRTVSWLYLGQTMVIHQRFDPEAVIDEIERSAITFTT